MKVAYQVQHYLCPIKNVCYRKATAHTNLHLNFHRYIFLSLKYYSYALYIILHDNHSQNEEKLWLQFHKQTKYEKNTGEKNVSCKKPPRCKERNCHPAFLRNKTVDFVWLVRLWTMKTLHFLDVRCLAESTAQPSLQLGIVRLGVSLLPTTSIFRPFLIICITKWLNITEQFENQYWEDNNSGREFENLQW